MGDRRTDAEAQRLIADFRAKHRAGPIGVWRSSLDHKLGWGFDGTGLLGNTLEFRRDGTGSLRSWGRGGERREEFRWSASGPCEVVIEAGRRDDEPADDEEAEVVRYDFFMVPGSEEVLLHQIDPPCDDNFWQAVGPLVRVLRDLDA